MTSRTIRDTAPAARNFSVPSILLPRLVALRTRNRHANAGLINVHGAPSPLFLRYQSSAGRGGTHTRANRDLSAVRVSPSGAGHLIAENMVGTRNTDSTLATSLPFASEASRAFCQSGSARNASQFFFAASRLGCARMYTRVLRDCGPSCSVQ